jgi:hypothetical protein
MDAFNPVDLWATNDKAELAHTDTTIKSKSGFNLTFIDLPNESDESSVINEIYYR